MAGLGNFSKDAKTVKQVEAENRAEGKRAKRREPGEAPSGYDQAVWTLAIRFKRYARADRIELASDLPIIHDVLADLVDLYEMRAKAKARRYRQEVEHCVRRLEPASMATRCWYHWPPKDPANQEAVVLTWEQMFEVIMAEFWSRIQDEHAVDMFRRFFRDYGQEAMEHWSNLRVAKRCEERRAMMAADSKEG